MALPVSADFPQNQILQYQWNNFPAVPQINTPPGLQQYLGAVAASVANEAGIKAQTNAARTFTYNLLSNNFWRNQEFSEACQLTVGLLYINLRKQLCSNPEQGMGTAASQVLAMITSRHVMQYQELVQKVDATTYQAAQMTAPVLQDLIREINAMQQSMHMGHMMQFQQQQSPLMVLTARGPMTLQDAQAFGLQYQPLPQQQQGMVPMHGGMPNGGLHTNGVGGGAVFTGNGFGNNQAHFSDTSEFVDARFAQAVKNFEPQQQQRQNTQVFQDVPEFDIHYRQPPGQAQEEEPVPQVKEVATSNELLIIKGSEMDRAKHELVYFGQSFSENLDLKIGKQAASAEVLSNSFANDPEEELVSQEFVFEPSLQVAIATGEKKRLEMRDKSKGGDCMYRSFVMIIAPLTAAAGTAAYMENIAASSDFSSMAKRIKAIALVLQEQKEKEGNSNDIEDILNVLTAVDTRLTNLINLFLKISLGLNVTIDSFVEDIDDLFQHLNAKNNLDRPLKDYEKDVIAVWNIVASDKTKQQINDFYGFNSDHDCALNIENISITHMVMNSRQLGWKVKNEPLLINRTTAPSLYQVAESLEKHKKEIGAGTLYDYLVSTDGVVYRIYRDYVTMGQFMISLA